VWVVIPEIQAGYFFVVLDHNVAKDPARLAFLVKKATLEDQVILEIREFQALRE
jgi:hypothetical protein